MSDSGNRQDSDDKPNVEEQYLSASGSSNLRVGNDSTLRTPGDMIAAAGMNKHRTGLALLRLRTEWDKTAKPVPMEPEQVVVNAGKLQVEGPMIRVVVPMTPEQIAAVAAQFALDPEKHKAIVWETRLEIPNPHAGLVRVEVEGEVAFRKPMAAATEQAAQWYAGKLLEHLEGLRTLPPVRDGLVQWLGRPDGVHIVAAVLLWWLDPKCHTCGGIGVRVVKGSGGRTSGKPCPTCKGASMVVGERRVPHGGFGRRVLSRINDCLRSAKVDLGEGAFRNTRSAKNDLMREAGK